MATDSATDRVIDTASWSSLYLVPYSKSTSPFSWTSFPSSFTVSCRTLLVDSPTTRFVNTLAFLPDYTEHPKRKHTGRHVHTPGRIPSDGADCNDNDETEVTFWHDFLAGGAAGSASVVVGHPFDTVKVRMQTSVIKAGTPANGLLATLGEFGGVGSLFRGMAAPLSAAAAINAVVFSSYGLASKGYDRYLVDPDYWNRLESDVDDATLAVTTTNSHDPWQKSSVCGSFAGLVQCTIICPMEHIKCRLQVQHGKGSADYKFKGPVQAIRSMVREHGITRLYQGWWVTTWREVPAFGLYFATYDYLKDWANTFLLSRALAAATVDGRDDDPDSFVPHHSHTWLASAFAGGCAGSLTWAIVYPVDVIKTRIQTAPLDQPRSQLRMLTVGADLVRQYGVRYLFRGLSVTLLRAFPVNGTIFPVYEFTLLQVGKFHAE